MLRAPCSTLIMESRLASRIAELLDFSCHRAMLINDIKSDQASSCSLALRGGIAS